MLKFSKRLVFFQGTILFFVLFLLLTLNTYCYADYQTTLLPGMYIQDGLSDLKANYWSVPVVYNWNGDEKKDLLVGRNYIDNNRVNHGYVSFYENSGTDSIPSFNGATNLQTCSNKCSALNVAAFG